MAYEIALTRLLSTLLVTAWVGPVLAVALLGLGLGAALAALSPAARTLPAARTAAGVAAVCGVLSLPAWLWAAASGAPLFGMLLPLCFYFATGLGGAAILSWWPTRAAWLLRADYASAAGAAALTPWALGRLGLGAPGGLLLACGLAALAALALRGQGVSAPAPLAATVLGLGGVLVALAGSALGAVGLEPGVHLGGKSISLALGAGGVVEESRWDATARTDQVRLPNGARYLYLDGGAGSLIPTQDESRWAHDVGAFAFALAPARSAFLIGSGGGLDVAQARANGVEEIVAIEVSAAAVALVRDLGAEAANVYDAPTEVVVGEGRRALAARAEPVDVITLANAVLGAAELRGAALTENSLYTVEAFGEYLSKLTSDGRLALKLYDEVTLTRAITTAVTALVEGRLAEDTAGAFDHLFAVLETGSDRPVPLLVVKRSPFELPDAVAAARVAEQRGWALLLVPGLLVPDVLRPVAEGRALLAELIGGSAGVDISPTRDASPYFFSFEPGVPRSVAVAVAVGALVLAALLVAASALGRRLGPPAGRLLASAVFLGTGLLLTQLATLPLIQRSVGQPAWSLSLTLGAVLLGSAVGARLAARSRTTSYRGAAVIAAIAVPTWCALAPQLTSALAPSEPLRSGVLLAVTLCVFAVPLGVPFPRLLAGLGRSTAVAAAVALSGLAAVAAGSGALWLSHAVGLPALAWAAGAAYLAAAVCAPVRGKGEADALSPRSPPSSSDAPSAP